MVQFGHVTQKSRDGNRHVWYGVTIIFQDHEKDSIEDSHNYEDPDSRVDMFDNEGHTNSQLGSPGMEYFLYQSSAREA